MANRMLRTTVSTIPNSTVLLFFPFYIKRGGGGRHLPVVIKLVFQSKKKPKNSLWLQNHEANFVSHSPMFSKQRYQLQT